MNFIIVHGTLGALEGNWFPWLKKELEKEGYKVFLPRFPTPKGQSLKNWLLVLNSLPVEFDKNLILVGHSSAPAVILRKLEEIEKPVFAIFLISGFLGEIGNEEYDKLNASFFKTSFNWKKIRKNTKHIFVYNSDNDPYVPLKKGRELAQKLGVELKVVKNAGHINSESGFYQFPQLLKDVKRLLGEN
jgi:predicted alpha/beta hydrolase family esterase